MKRILFLTLQTVSFLGFSQVSPEVRIGQTLYDLQTNNSVNNRLENFGDGTLSALWTFSNESGSPFYDRGMAYHQFDGTAWTKLPAYGDLGNINRIEDVRTGFGSLARVNGVGDIVIAHQTAQFNGGIDALQISRNTSINPAGENWITTPNTDMPLIWPRMRTGGPDGKTVHIIGITIPTGAAFNGTLYNGINGCLTYNRSTDGGVTFDKLMIQLPDVDSTVFRSFSGDSYAMDVKGSTIAIVAGNSTSRVNLWKSTDNGETWTSRTVLPFQYEPWTDSELTDFNGDGLVDSFLVNGSYELEQVETNDGSFAIILDNNNQAHIFYGLEYMSNDVVADEATSFDPNANGIMYWNEGFAAFALPRKIGGAIDADGDSSTFNVYTYFTGTNKVPYESGMAGFPSVGIDAAGALYLSYSAYKEGENYISWTGPSCKHIYLQKSTDGGITWTDPIDIVGDQSAGFDQMAEYQYCSMARLVDENIHLLYQRDYFPGSAVTINDASIHPFDLVNDIIYMKVNKNTLLPSYLNKGNIQQPTLGLINGAYNPDPISFSSNPSGCASFSYQWYSKSGVVSAPIGNSTIGWTLIPGATSNTYDPPTLFNSTSFACFVTPLSSCGSAGWAAGVATYSIVSSLGAITGNGYSSSNNPASLSFSAISSGCPSFSYQWYSTSGIVSAPTGSSTIGWTLIPGATANTYDPPTLFNSTSYACFITPSFGCLTSGWAGGVASFNITTSSGSVNGQQVSQCTSSAVPLTFSSQPVGLGNTTYQWYFANGAVSCPQGNATSGWTAIAGATSSTSSFLPPSLGTYTLACLVTPEGTTGLPFQWANGCKTVVINSFTAQSIIGNPNITPFTPYTYLVSQTVGHTYTWTAYGGAVSTGQSTNQVSIIWAATGPYQVMLVENNGVCSDTSYLDVVSSSCALTMNVISIDPTTFCANGQARLIANASPGVSYQWKLNGSILPGQTNDTLVATASGSYQAIAVLDASCSAISQPISLTELPSLTAPVITLNGSPSSCNSVAPTLTANGNYSTFLWNTGEISQSITPAASGNYSVSVSDVNGCTAQSIPQVVNLALLPPVDICVVSVDSLTGHNIIVWEKPFTTLIDSFVIFRESVVSNVYEPIGTQAYGNFSTFIDPQSNPLAQASRYKLGLVDTCGTLSSTSDMHKTMHLTLNLGVGGTVNLIWSGYEGINFGSYKIYRGTALDNMSLLITIQSSLNSYTDLTPPSGTVYYQLEIVIPGCNPTAFGFLSSRSNIANTGAIGFDQLNLDEVRVFPNPTDLGFTVQSKAIIAGESIELLDQVGRLVIQTHAAANSTYISTAHLAKGIYFLRLPKHPGYSQKLIVN
jgi:hypothetical protein